METLLQKENSTKSILDLQHTEEGFQVSTVFKSDTWINLFREFRFNAGSPFIKNEMIGTTIFTSVPVASPERDDDDYETGYYNDDYDIVANVPFKESFKIKVKIRSITRPEPTVFIDNDLLDQVF